MLLHRPSPLTCFTNELISCLDDAVEVAIGLTTDALIPVAVAVSVLLPNESALVQLAAVVVSFNAQ